MKKLKLFVWTEFCPAYADGLAFAIAEDEDRARKLVIETHGYDPYEWGDLEIRNLNLPTAECVSGGS